MRRHTRLLFVVFLTLATAIALFGGRYFFAEKFRERALAEGKRVEISLITGEVISAPAGQSEEESSEEKTQTPENAPASDQAASNSDQASEQADSVAVEETPSNESAATDSSAAEVSAESKESTVTSQEETAPKQEATAEEHSSTEATAESDTAQSAEKPAEKTDSVDKKATEALSEAEIKLQAAALVDQKKEAPVGDDIYGTLPVNGKPMIVVLVKGLGLGTSSTELALQLPKEVTLGFSPYSPTIKEWVERSIKEGHETVLHLPMQTPNAAQSDPGPYALLSNASEEENALRLRMLLDLAPDIKGVYSDSDESLTLAITTMLPILTQLKEKNLPFIYGVGYANQVLLQRAIEMDRPLIASDSTIDDEINSDAIAENLLRIEQLAAKKGYAIVIAHPYPVTINLLGKWLKVMDKKNISVVPLSTFSDGFFKHVIAKHAAEEKEGKKE